MNASEKAFYQNIWCLDKGKGKVDSCFSPRGNILINLNFYYVYTRVPDTLKKNKIKKNQIT